MADGYEPGAPQYASEREVELKDGGTATVRVSVQNGKVVGGSFTVAPGYALSVDDIGKLGWDTAARSTLRSAPKTKEDSK